MPLRSRIAGAVRALFQKQRVEEELDEELRAFLDAATEDKIAAGFGGEAARRRAHAEIGSIEAVKDRVRDVGWESMMDSIWQDVRLAVRLLRRSPGFATVAIVTLALGIGANTAIFSVVNGLLLRVLPVADPERLVTITSATDMNQRRTAVWTYATWDQMRQRATAFDGAFAWSAARFNLPDDAGVRPVDGVWASGEFFSTLGVPALIGRTFIPADDVRGGGSEGPVAVISNALWHRRFGGDPNIVGRSLVVEGVPFTIIGVTPPGFFGVEVGRTFDIALPLGAEPLVRGKDTLFNDALVTRWLRIVLRVKPGQSIDAATSALRAVQPQIREGAMPNGLFAKAQKEFLQEPFSLVRMAAGTSELRRRYERPLLTIFIVVALVLLIACANLANLLLARSAARRHEVSVRLALGAPRRRLARQLIIESLVLASAGAALGFVLAVWASRALVAQLSSPYSPSVFLDLSLDWRVLGFTAAVTLATALLFGAGPAFRAAGSGSIDALRSPRTPGGSASGRLSRVLIVVQVSLSLVLLVAAGLFIRTFQRLASVPLGFERDRVLVINIDATHARVAPAERNPFYHRLVNAVAAVPGVAHAAGALATPASGGLFFPVLVDVPGAPRKSDPARESIANFVTPGWFPAYGTVIHAGRDIDDRDTKDAAPIVLVNETFARRFFPDGHAVGSSVTVAAGGGDLPMGLKTIAGVVGDAVSGSLREGVRPTLYFPLAQWNFPVPMLPRFTISVSAVSGPPVLLARSIAAALTTDDRNVRFTVRPLADDVNASFAQERLVALMSGFFGGLALLLAALGLYGITAYAVARRRTEIGIRMALGAQRADVIGVVIRESVAMTTAGIAIGLASAAMVTRYAEGMLFGLGPLDPTTFVGVAATFAAIAILAAFVPAHRAANVDPMIALRCE